MLHSKQGCGLMFGANPCVATAALAIVLGVGLLGVVSPAAQAQTYKVIHDFTGGRDGANPDAGLTIDAHGNLYGTASGGGTSGHGTVFKLRGGGSGWIFTPLYSFAGGDDGDWPATKLAIGADGTLYGTTLYGGAAGRCDYGTGCGTVFNVRPSPTPPVSTLSPWKETVLYRFKGGSDGYSPYGDLIFDQAGSVYGTTWSGGRYSYCQGNPCGTVYKLEHSGGGWGETVLHNFDEGNDGRGPESGVTLDKAGSLYGTTEAGGLYQNGTVFQLTSSGPAWAENILYSFSGGTDGALPAGGLIFDRSGNLYGTTASGGQGAGGTVFELTPLNESWVISVLLSFKGGTGPLGSLLMDDAGNLYSTAFGDSQYNYGLVFKLTPSGSGWTYTTLHYFGGSGNGDGSNPVGSLVLDTNGNLYGTTLNGGANSRGIVWEITP